MNNNYKLICLDLDGTLLTPKHKLNLKTVDYLKKLVAKGIYVSIATGRANYDAKYHAEQIGMETFYIASNGASFGETANTKLIYEESLTDDSVDKIISVCEEFKTKPVFYTRDYILIYGMKNYIMHVLYAFYGAKQLRKRLKLFSSINKLRTFYKDNNYKVQKGIIFLSAEDKISECKKKLGTDNFDIAVIPKFGMEITPKDVNKAKGVKALVEKLDIKPSEVIAFGDSENDVEMLKYVGRGIAMGNAYDSVKAIADDVADSNNEDGIYKKLVEIFGEL